MTSDAATLVDIPVHWTATTIGAIAKITSGGTPNRTVQEYWDGDIPWITTSKIDFGIIKDADEFISAEGLRNSAAKIFPTRTILMAMYGQGVTRGKVGILGIDAATNQACAALMVNEALATVEYVFYYLAFRYHDIRELGHGGNQKNLNAGLIKGIAMPLPPLSEQRHIVDVLATWDHAIDLAAQLIAAKQEHKRGLMQQLLTGQRRLSAFQEEWSSATFGQVFSAKNARNSGSLIRNPITVGKYAIRPQQEHFNRVVASDNLENYNIIEEGDFVYDPMSAYYGAFGRYELEEPGIVSPVYRVLRINPGYDSDFVKYLIKSHHITYQISANSSQGNRHGKRRTIHDDAFDSISFALPDIDEQGAIAQVLNTCDRELALLDRKLTLLKQQKQGLMQQLLTGKVQVAA